MPRFFTALLFLFSFLACSFDATAAPAPAVAASAASGAAAPVVLTPDQARQALIVLNDPKRRAQVEDTLRAVAAAGALAAPAPVASAPAAAAPASAASGVAAAFKSNGLVTQLSRQLAHWAQSIARETRHSLFALLDLRSVRAWWTERLRTPSGTALLLNIGWIMLATLVPAGIVEWLLTRLALKPRRKIAARANADAEAQRAEAALTPAEREDARNEQIAAALKDDEKHVQPLSQTPTVKGKLHALRHWALFRRMPAALLNAILAAVPVVGFALVASLIMSMLTEDGSITEDIVSRLVDIYVICRGVLIIVNLFIAPRSPGLRLWRVGTASALFCQGWMRRIVAVVGVGSALAEVPMPLGLSEDAHIAIMKLTALVAHVMVAIVILECRQPVGHWLRQSTASNRSLSHLGNWLADIWAGVAVFFVLALWLIWALDVDNGFETLVHLGGLSLAVLVVARMVAIVALGALAHLFRVNQGDDEAAGTSTATLAGTPSQAEDAAAASSSSDPAGEPPPTEEPSIVQRRAYRYYPIVRQVVSAVVGLIAVLTLLDIWGVHLLRFLAASPTGHRLLSALVTIAIAGAVAVLIWEAVNISFERRLRAWTDRGEFVRASRLRTLMPMLRSALLVAIALIVGLTGLSQIGVNTAPLLAGASIFGVALGFGSQKLVQDFITGIFLLMENAMQVGDTVTVAGVSGSVEYLSIRTVRLRGGDGSLFTVPFSSVTTVNNVNRGIGNASVRISIAFGADVDRAIALLKSIGEGLRSDAAFKDGILSDFSFWGVDAVDGSAVTLAGQIQCRDSMRWPVQREFNRRILARFTAEGIEIANPLRNVMVPGQAPSNAARTEETTAVATTPQTPATQSPVAPAAPDAEARPAAPSGAADAGKH